MRKILSSITVLSFLLLLIIPVKANAATVLLDNLTLTTDCSTAVPPEDYYWEAEWFDEIPYPSGTVNETSYKLEGPCKVFFGDTFEVRITVTDTGCLTGGLFGGTVANAWFLTDTLLSTPTVETTVDSGNFFFNDINVFPDLGVWQRSYMRPTPSADDHDFEFNAEDLGKCAGAHNLGGSVIQGTVIDPLPPTNTAPVVDAGASVVILSIDQSSTIISGSATDADGDPLTYTWYEGAVELQGPNSVEPGGGTPLYLASVAPISIGTHLLTLEVTDNTATVSDTMELSIDNSAPNAVASGGGTYNLGDNITIGASVSDFDGDALSYTWTLGPDVISTGSVPTAYGGAPTALPPHEITGGLSLGTHVLDLTIFDGANTIYTDIIVDVVDTEAPTLSPTATPNMLWPPNNSMLDVLIAANALDNSGSVTLNVTVTSTAGTGDDYTVVSVDQGAGTANLQLRANKSNIDYTVTVVATDSSGNSSSSDVVVTVPHDIRDKR